MQWGLHVYRTDTNQALLGLAWRWRRHGKAQAQELGLFQACGRWRAAQQFIIPELDMKSPLSIVSLAKDLVKYVKGHSVPNGMYRRELAAFNTRQRALDEPTAVTLKLPGDTRATSTANCLTSVSRSRPLLRAMVTSDDWDDYVDPKKMTKKEDRDKANTIQRLIRHQPSMDGIEVFGRFLTLIQVWQRVVAKRNKTLSDAVYDTAEVLKRIDAFEGVSDSVKAKMKGAIVFRFDKGWWKVVLPLFRRDAPGI